jgi:guanylate kinase
VYNDGEASDMGAMNATEVRERETMCPLPGLLIVLSGPSGVGKGTVCARLRQRNPELTYSVSATTRLPRRGEVDGQTYFFKTKDQFQRMIAAGDLLEWAQYAGYLYGTPRAFVQQQLDMGHDVLLEIEVQGAQQVRSQFPEAVCVFLLPPSIEVLRDRIVGRGTECTDALQARWQALESELRMVHAYDYAVTNDDIDVACVHVEGIVHAEKARASRQARIVEQWLQEEVTHVISID